MYMMMARAASLRSTCQRLNVGAIIVHNRKVVSIGYNGAPAGKDHCGGNDCPGRWFCHETIHAEHNAVTGLGKVDVTGKEMDLYSTHSPCRECCELIQWTPVKRVFFETPYRQADHLDRYRSQFEMYQVMPSGYVLEWFEREVVELA